MEKLEEKKWIAISEKWKQGCVYLVLQKRVEGEWFFGYVRESKEKGGGEIE